MKYFRLTYQDGSQKIVKAKKALDVIRKYDLCTKDNIGTKITELNGNYTWLDSVTNVLEYA